MTYFSMRQVREDNAARGHYWFSPATMRFFRSRVSRTVYDHGHGGYFVSSEQGPDGIRRYTVRVCIDGDIQTVGAFQQYATWAAADRAARKLSR